VASSGWRIRLSGRAPLVVLPGVYIAVAYLASLLWRRRSTWLRGAVALWGLTVLAADVGMFPFVAIF
jgi:hypothetical protein